MNPKFSIALIALMMLALGLYAGKKFDSPKPTERDLTDVTWLTAALGLDAEQAKQIQAIQNQYVEKLEGSCGAHCRSRMKMAGQLFNPADPSTDESMLKELADAVLAAERQTLQHLRTIHAQLTPEQQSKYEEMVKGCLCAECGFCSSE